MLDCLFCKIIAKEIPNYTVYEDENVLAFLDIHPCSKGHTVVVPKKHFADLAEMSVEDWQNMNGGLFRAFSKVQSVLNPDGINLGINNGKAAGQAVGHVHWHLIPRWHGDGGTSMHGIVRNGEGVDVKEIAEKFKI
ncbi:MAG: Histidine triad protein [Candidatus Magasanikbacteria bacterium GW2011_GWA2_40_10]|uniref:Histidine triad protein n=1 Tax=Candidatus Magasanikbacteria bacterium GW2011_GWA2_40_10 TaxID=1619037 RepID=A0A0G0T9D5_9BACT|nr:MAG: Histidine triad protein [Candidatus Magasanikbacteria bacterium GW2011_GWA2_40_10]